MSTLHPADELPRHAGIAARVHPSNWPLVVWTLLSIVAGLLHIQYTVGGFSFAPAVALLSGTWLGWRRAALVQAVAAFTVVVLGLLFGETLPGVGSAASWGFHLGVVGSAALAGVVATPDGNGAHPSRAVRLAVFGVAGATAALAVIVVPRQSSGVLFAAAFMLATTIAIFYAYRMVPEPGRVVGYAFCLLPYYALGVGWNLLVARFMPATAALEGIPERWHDVVFHAYLAHLPSELIAVVVIAYLVCALDRGACSGGPMAIGASR